LPRDVGLEEICTISIIIVDTKILSGVGVIITKIDSECLVYFLLWVLESENGLTFL
jgi:hypothetical protein